MRPAIRHSALALYALALAGCARGPTLEPTGADPCVLVAGVPLADTVTVGLAGEVDPRHAPVPLADAEGLLFGTVYSTLVVVDCEGAVRPGLAESWTAGDAGTRWTFRMRADATFWDGSPVTAGAVRESWSARSFESFQPWADSLSTSVTAADARTLIVSLRHRGEAALRALADPRLAVTGGTSGPWPIGAGPYGVSHLDQGSFIARPVRGMSRDPLPVLRFMPAGRDPRDLLDRRVDLLATRAPEVIDYGMRLPEYRVLPLPWDRVYVLVAPSRLGGAGEMVDPALSAQLAADVIRDEARPARDAYWWADVAACGPPRLLPVSLPDTLAPQLVYPDGDPVARVIAERLVALARAGELTEFVPALGMPALSRLPATALSAVGAPAGRLYDVRTWPPSAALVIALPARTLDPCTSLEELRRRLGSLTPLAIQRVVVPLVETRRSLILREGMAGVALGWDGAPVLTFGRRSER
jgi:hypothetical protein